MELNEKPWCPGQACQHRYKLAAARIATFEAWASLSADSIAVSAPKPLSRLGTLRTKVRRIAALALLCLAVSCTQLSQAQDWIRITQAQEWTKDPTTWWPDPSTGLMWTGQIHAGPSTYPKVAMPGRSQFYMGLNWQQANDYCASLHVGNFAGWRLPTLDEVKEAIVVIRVTSVPGCPVSAYRHGCRDQDLTPGKKYVGLSLKGGISLFTQDMTIWTATPSQADAKSAWKVDLVSIPNEYDSLVEVTKASLPQADSNSAWEAALKSADWNPLRTEVMTQVYPGAVCVRPMEPDILQVAKEAEPYQPVPDVQTLKNYIPLNKARLAYQAGNYQESIAQAQIALSLKTDPAKAYWGIGLSYGRLAQWDQAISNLQSALAINQNHHDAKTALKWAKDGLKAAKKRKLPKEQSPKWN